MKEKKTVLQNQTMPAIALRGLVLFPKMVLHFDIGREKSILALNHAMENDRRIFLTAQSDVQDDNPGPKDLYQVGVVAQVQQVIRVQGSGLRVMAEGLYRAKMLRIRQEEPYFIADIRAFPTRRLPAASQDMASALIRTVKNLFQEYCELSPKMPKELVLGVMMSEDPALLSEYIAGNVPLPVEEKQEVLEQSNLLRRLEILAEIFENENEILRLEAGIYEKVKSRVDRNQKDYYLREQMKVISEELGEDDSPENEINTYFEKIDALKVSDEVREKLTKEVNRLGKMPGSSQEAAVIRGYLDTCLELPWNSLKPVKSDIAQAQKILNHDHYGMEKIKERVLESIAVRALAPNIKGQILCLVGPPGVGKTSIAKSIAKATGRDYVRISLGGVKDESDIRGHRKTYIGSMPGRIIDAMRRAGSRNPLMLLDEVDKLGGDYKGDPSSALLEVLDSEQNHAFRDHFVELPFDLSDVMFVATANSADMIPAPLYDRMEVIELSSYTREEKFHIAKDYLIPKQRERHGLNGRQARITDEALYTIIDSYTRESGVRRLERSCASVFRKCAKRIVAKEAKQVIVTLSNLGDLLGPKKYYPDALANRDEVGVVNGLAWTSVGGEMLQVEVAILDGTGKLELTGKLGDVMKESAQAAVSYLRAHADAYGISRTFHKDKDIHIHVPEGAVPKDGPSAGITICTALLSALADIPVKFDVAMTGEMTLRGRVLPIGGLREKTMAALRNNIKTVVIPADNEPDIDELDSAVKKAIRFVPARSIGDVLPVALSVMPAPVPTLSEEEYAVNLLSEAKSTPRHPVTC
ncbi:endopeptidase La [Oscillospiraceae bacterium MB24-C1]|nr:endopeptidase La [Oscillospiraceae bacterium MB24-C1]